MPYPLEIFLVSKIPFHQPAKYSLVGKITTLLAETLRFGESVNSPFAPPLFSNEKATQNVKQRNVQLCDKRVQ